jgi:hypothetical protein
MANIKDYIKKLEDGTLSLEEQQEAIAKIEETIKIAKQKRDEAVGQKADMVVSALKQIEDRLNSKYEELLQTPAMVGAQGPQGIVGRDGKDGVNGRDGKDGVDGKDGKDGIDGVDGISVVDARVDFDGGLVITLSDGNEIDAGQIFSPEVAQNIQIFRGGGGGVSLPPQTDNAGKVLTTDGSSLSWAAASGGISTANIQEFTSVGTSNWSKPVGAKLVYVLCQGGGGGGGSGFKQAAVSADAAVSGGQGGHAGGWAEAYIPAVLLADTVSVTVGAGGTGAAGNTASGSTAGGIGENSFFADWVLARGNNGGAGGTTGTSGGGTGTGTTANIPPINISTTALLGTSASPTRGSTGNANQRGGKNGGAGGGGGGLAYVSPANRAGGVGGLGGAGVNSSSTSTTGGGGAGGTTAGVPAVNGADSLNDYVGGSGGGGGFALTTANGGDGATGGYPGGGGGGGGASLNAYNSGAGGNGGDGYVLVITLF